MPMGNPIGMIVISVGNCLVGGGNIRDQMRSLICSHDQYSAFGLPPH